MKFKLIILFFNVFILISFSALFFLPLSVLGWAYVAEFWAANWLLLLFFVVLVLILNAFFISNWSILKYVEKGDWASLVPVLEKDIFTRKKIRYTSIRLLIHSYFLMSKTDRIEKLESTTRTEKPGLYKKTFLMFASVHLLKDTPEELENYLSEAYSDSRYSGRDWIAIYYAFSLLAGNKRENADSVLSDLEKKKVSPVSRLTILYMLSLCSVSDADLLEKKKNSFTGKISEEKFKNLLDKEKEELNVLFFSKLIEQAQEWAYS